MWDFDVIWFICWHDPPLAALSFLLMKFIARVSFPMYMHLFLNVEYGQLNTCIADLKFQRHCNSFYLFSFIISCGDLMIMRVRPELSGSCKTMNHGRVRLTSPRTGTDTDTHIFNSSPPWNQLSWILFYFYLLLHYISINIYMFNSSRKK